MNENNYYLSSNDGLSFYNANYCIKCLSNKYSQQYTKFEQATKEKPEISAKREGFLCTCFNCSFSWLAPINKETYYTLEAAEQLECIKLFLDKANVPTHSEDGQQYSFVGRIQQLILIRTEEVRSKTSKFFQK